MILVGLRKEGGDISNDEADARHTLLTCSAFKLCKYRSQVSSSFGMGSLGRSACLENVTPSLDGMALVLMGKWMLP